MREILTPRRTIRTPFADATIPGNRLSSARITRDVKKHCRQIRTFDARVKKRISPNTGQFALLVFISEPFPISGPKSDEGTEGTC